MRIPEDVTPRAPKRQHRRRWLIVAVIVVLVVILASLRTLATAYTDELWFSSVHLHSVWSTLLDVKVGLFVAFGVLFFLLLWINLMVCDRLGANSVTLDPEDELVRRYQRIVRPYSGRVYAGVAILLALVAASSTIGQWQNWLLFTNSQSFPNADPQFHLNDGFFIFDLPFLSFLVNWILLSLVVVTIVVAVFHYLNGGIKPQRTAPRVGPAVKAHLSVLLALIALAKAAGYFLSRYQLDTSTNGYVEGAGYTDVHARLPALTLLFWVSLAAAAVLLWNIRRRGWTLPVLAVGVWAFVALVVGVIYPNLLQVLKVSPAQSSLELPYISRNIKATRAAYAINNVPVSKFQANQNTSASTLASNVTTLSNARLWDPDVSLTTFQKKQDIHGYYSLPELSVDRYKVNQKETPAIVAVRQINQSGVSSQTWVNVHLQYTHGEGMVLAMANQASNGLPVYGISNVPTQSDAGLPKVTQPDVYFGLNQSGYVVANTRQKEFDYQTPSGQTVEDHYKGTGGVQLSSFLRRAAFALRLGDFNLLISDLLTPDSRIMFVRDIQQMAEKAAPFLSFDSDPYPVLVHGHIDWVLDGYTSTTEYPYSQNADLALLPPNSGLPSSYNYVRNSVKVVIDAYSGSMTFYAMNQSDPILRAYEQAFPDMFTPASKMNSTLRAHLRYPGNIFAAQAAMYARYHVTSSSAFYGAGGRWNLSPSAGIGNPSQTLQATVVTTPEGQEVNGPLVRMSPIYQVLQQPGQSKQSFTTTEAFVPYSNNDQIQTLSAFMMGDSDPGQYGKLHVYELPSGSSVDGPLLVDAEIESTQSVSKEVTLLNQNGSSVQVGSMLMVPIGQSMLYVRPLYVTSSSNSFPTLQELIVVLGSHVGIGPTLQSALVAAGLPAGNLGSSSSQSSGASTPITNNPQVDAQVQRELQAASQAYSQAKQALSSGNLGAYQSDISQMASDLQQAEQLLNSSAASKGTAKSSPSTTTTTAASHSTSTTQSSPSNAPQGTTQTSSSHSTTTAPSRSTAKEPSGSGTTSTTSGSRNSTADSPDRSAHQSAAPT